MHADNPNSWEARRLCIWGLPGLHNEAVKKQTKTKTLLSRKTDPSQVISEGDAYALSTAWIKEGQPCFPPSRDHFPIRSCLEKNRTGASNEREMCREQQTEQHWKSRSWIRCGSWNGEERSYKLPSRLVVPSRVQNASNRRVTLTVRQC